MDLTAAVALKIPPEMLVELALGMEDPVTVARRHGYSEKDYETLAKQPWFLKVLSAKQQELADQGWTFRAKMAMLAEDLLVDVWMEAKSSESASFKLDAAKYLTKVADLEPKPAQQSAGAGGGGGFSIVINIPQLPPGFEDAYRSKGASEAKQEPPTIDITPNKPDTPKVLENLTVPDFDLSMNGDLILAPTQLLGE